MTSAEVRGAFRGTNIRLGSGSLSRRLANAAAMFQLVRLEAFHGLSVWSVPAIHGSSEPVKLVIAGELHTTPGRGDQLMRYIAGQVEFEGKCVDLYIESGFDWRPVQSGGSALVQIRQNYPDVPGLRVHHVDVRSIIAGSDLPRVNHTHHLDMIQMLSDTFYHSDPYHYRYYYSHAATDPTMALLRAHDLFTINTREHFALVTGFAPILTGTDRTLPQVVARFASDSETYAALRRAPGGDVHTSAFHPPSVFAVMRSRFAKQRRRFLRTTNLPPAQLDTRIRAWATPYMHGFRTADPIMVDLFAFYRMFGSFTARATGSNNKAGCPMEQRNIVYLAGDLHGRALATLVQAVFGVAPVVARGTHVSLAPGSVVHYNEATRTHVRDMPPTTVF